MRLTGLLFRRFAPRNDEIKTQRYRIVIASKAKQSRAAVRLTGLLRRFAPRNDEKIANATGCPTSWPTDAMAPSTSGSDVNLPQRAWLHRTGAVAGFTKRYGCKMLVWYELHATMPNAIAHEKQIKGGARQKKLALIEALNPNWRDLFDELI